MQLTDIFLYPIKSTQSYGVQQALVQLQGLNFDREFMLTEPSGKFITARKDGELYRFSAFPIPFGLYVQHQDGSQLIVKYQDFQQELLQKKCLFLFVKSILATRQLLIQKETLILKQAFLFQCSRFAETKKSEFLKWV